MKLLLIAAMVGSAFAGACVTTGAVSGDIGNNAAFKFFCQNGGTLSGASTGTTTVTTGADNTCACACATTGAKLYSGVDCATELACTATTAAAALALGYTASGGTTVTAQAAISCGATSFKTAAAVDPKVACATAGAALDFSGCTLCTKPTGTTSATCTSATANTDVGCADGYYRTAQTAGVDAVTRVCLPEATGATTSTPGVDKVDFIQASCTACAGEQTGCATKTATEVTANEDTCSTGNNLECTRTNTGYSVASGAVTKCSQVGVATYTAATASISGDCVALTCSTGYTKSGDAGSILCTANACTATAVTEGYTAAGLPLVTGVDYAAATGSAKACPATTVVAMVPMVTARLAAAVVLAKDALNVADVGTVACATGYTAAAAGAAATCPTAAGPIVYTGCSKAVAAPASAAQTMIACVLAVVAMYL